MKNILLILSAGVFCFTECRVYNFVTVNNLSKADFETYSSYAWLPDMADTCAMPYNNGVIRDNTRSYIGKRFSNLGYTFRPDSPDVLLQLVISNKKVTEEIMYFPSNSKYFSGNEHYNNDGGKEYYAHKDAYCYPMGYCIERIEYIKDEISMNVIDRKKNELVWSCTAKGNIYDHKFKDEDIHPAVKAIMKKYPGNKKSH